MRERPGIRADGRMFDACGRGLPDAGDDPPLTLTNSVTVAPSIRQAHWPRTPDAYGARHR
jgi:hypothetical protein